MRSRTTDTELAQAIARNPQLRLKRPCGAAGHKDLQGTPESQPQAKDASVRHMSRVDYKAEIVRQCGRAGVPELIPEFCFARPRKFRSDWRVEGLPVLIEYDGGIFMAGKAGHSSVKGLLRDIEKLNMAAIAGYIVIRITPKHVVSGEALMWIERAVERAKAIYAVIKLAGELQKANQ